MADNVAVTAGTGTTIATDDVGGAQHQRVKVTWGADGVGNDANATTPLPVTTYGPAAHDAAVSGNPVRIGARARTTEMAAVASDDATDLVADKFGKLVVRQNAVGAVTCNSRTASTITNTSDAELKAAPGASNRLCIAYIGLSNADASVTTWVDIKDGATTIAQVFLPALGGQAQLNLPMPLQLTANTALNIACRTNSAEVEAFCIGWVEPA